MKKDHWKRADHNKKIVEEDQHEVGIEYPKRDNLSGKKKSFSPLDQIIIEIAKVKESKGKHENTRFNYN